MRGASDCTCMIILLSSAANALERMLLLALEQRTARLTILIDPRKKAVFERLCAEADLDLEIGAVSMYNKSIQVARDAGDDASRELFTLLLKDEEEHVDWIETQKERIRQVGIQNYIQSQM